MPVNGMNVGVDYSFSYFDGNSGALVNLGDVQNVKITGQKHDIKSMPYNDVPRFGYVPDGYKIDFTITRSVAVLEDFMATYSAAFNAGQVLQPGYIHETVNNADGSVRRYQYTNVVVYLVDPGDVTREKVVTMRLESMASDKIIIS